MPWNMEKQKASYSRRSIIGGLVAIGGASAAAGAGTMAAFSDTESSSGNTVSAGTLDLNIDGGNSTVQFLSETNVAPGDSGQSTLDIKNTGTVTGYVDIEVASLTNYENGLVGNEKSEDSTGGDPGKGNGELQNLVEVAARFQNGPELWSGYQPLSNALNEGAVYDLDYELSSNTSDTFVLDWQFPDSGKQDREAQSDSVEFSLTFSLEQQQDNGL